MNHFGESLLSKSKLFSPPPPRLATGGGHSITPAAPSTKQPCPTQNEQDKRPSTNAEWRRRLYSRPSSLISLSGIRKSRNSTTVGPQVGFGSMSFKFSQLMKQSSNLTSYLETPWWGSYIAPLDELDRDTFINRTEMALDAARAAESSLIAAKNYLKHLVLEQELSMKQLKDEIEDVKFKSWAARQQVASLGATLILEGVSPSIPDPIYSAEFAPSDPIYILDSDDEDGV